MSDLTLRSYLLLAIILFSSLLLSAQPRKLALLVGIDAYAETTGMRPLQVCNGIGLMRQTLQAQGFEPDDVLDLTNEQATASAIREAMHHHLGQAGSGDIVLFHFTGHGMQIPDENGDEADGLDEALVPFDARKGDPNSILRDDQIGEWLNDLCQKTGVSGQVIALVDACHAGGSTRGKGSSEWQTRHYSEDQAPLTAFFASLPHERSFQVRGDDGKPYGPLTYAFCRAMQKAGPETTYRGLFDRIAGILAVKAFRQTPEAQGELDRLLFGGRVASPPAYFKPLVVLDGQHAFLRGGRLNGLHPGTEVALFPVDTRDTVGHAPLAVGVIEEEQAGLLECRLSLDRSLPEETFEQSWIFVRRYSISGPEVGIMLEIEDEGLRREVGQMIGQLASVHLVKADPDLLIRQEGRRRVELWLSDSTMLFSEPYSKNLLSALQSAIGQHLQARFLRGLELESAAYQVEFSLEAPEGSAVIRAEKDVSLLTVANQGGSRIFYTLLDIDPSDKVTLLLPSEGWSPSDLILDTGESRTHRLSFDTPGREVLKLIVTPRPIDLRQALVARQQGAVDSHFIEDLFAEWDPAWSGRRSAEISYQREEAAVKTLIFEITE